MSAAIDRKVEKRRRVLLQKIARLDDFIAMHKKLSREVDAYAKVRRARAEWMAHANVVIEGIAVPTPGKS